MRTVQSVILAAALTAAFPAISSAQSQTPPPPAPAPSQPAPPGTVNVHEPTTSYWTASGFVGSNFGAGADSASVDFGGQLA